MDAALAIAVAPSRMCRICLEDDGDDFISPCLCKGTVMYVHSSCWNRWRATSGNPLSFYRCEHCHFFYDLSAEQQIGRTLLFIKELDRVQQDRRRNASGFSITAKLLLVYSLSLCVVLLPLWLVGACTAKLLATSGIGLECDSPLVQLLWGVIVLGCGLGVYLMAKGLFNLLRSCWESEGPAIIGASVLFYILFCL